MDSIGTCGPEVVYYSWCSPFWWDEGSPLSNTRGKQTRRVGSRRLVDRPEPYRERRPYLVATCSTFDRLPRGHDDSVHLRFHIALIMRVHLLYHNGTNCGTIGRPIAYDWYVRQYPYTSDSLTQRNRNIIRPIVPILLSDSCRTLTL